jgi:hypothetical protein
MLDRDNIHREAEKERQKQSAKAGRTRSPGKKSFVSQPADSFYVFRRIYPHQPNRLIVFALPMVLAVTGITLLLTDKKKFGWLWPYTLAVALVPLFSYLLTALRKRLDYRVYRTWRIHLDFPVQGWDELGRSEKFPKSQYWKDLLTVEVKLRNGTAAADVKLVEDLLFLFTKKANGWFYAADQAQAGLAGDIRKKWKPVGTLTVAGSADGGVMGELYLLLHRQFRNLHTQSGCIERVELQYSGSIYEITPERSSD